MNTIKNIGITQLKIMGGVGAIIGIGVIAKQTIDKIKSSKEEKPIKVKYTVVEA